MGNPREKLRTAQKVSIRVAIPSSQQMSFSRSAHFSLDVPSFLIVIFLFGPCAFSLLQILQSQSLNHFLFLFTLLHPFFLPTYSLPIAHSFGHHAYFY